jgi:type IV pilus assembly protein PilA
MSQLGDIKKRGHRMPKSLKDMRGFTLIEMMLVIGIIATLAAIAIPTFMNYQTKSKQTEAKVNLAGIFTSEHTYFTEHNFFTEDIIGSGFSFSGKPKYYDFTCATPAAISGTAPDITCSWVVGSWVGLHGTSGDGPGAGVSFGLNEIPGAQGNYFTAIAVGNVDNDPEMDVWTITHGGLVHDQHDDASE